jgi:hypothetical protein
VHKVSLGWYKSVNLLITSICSNVNWTASLYWESQGTYAAQNWNITIDLNVDTDANEGAVRGENGENCKEIGRFLEAGKFDKLN